MSKPDLRKDLAGQRQEAPWKVLRQHVARDAVIIVLETLDLVEVGYRVAIDDTQAIKTWIKTGEVTKPTSLQLTLWEQAPERLFQCLIVQPYVLIQEIPEVIQ